MKKTVVYGLLASLLLVACKNDDSDFSAYTDATGTITTIYINYNGTTASVSGDSQGVVSVSGADVTVTSQYADSLLLVLSGSTTDGSLLVYRSRKYGILLNGVSIHNADGPAINNQGKKSLFLKCAAGTTNTLTDGTAYAEAPYNASGEQIDQKGALFSEGQIFFLGTGALSVTGSYKHAIASDDYIVVADNVSLTASSSAGNGIKVNDGLWINNGTLNISVTADAARGIKCDAEMYVTGGTTTITTSGGCVAETSETTADDGTVTTTTDYSSAAGIKSEGAFTMSGGTLTVTTTGTNNYSKPKGIKSDTAITVSGGTLNVTVNKSWACDNGYDDDTLNDDELAKKRIDVLGSPTTETVTKKVVSVVY